MWKNGKRWVYSISYDEGCRLLLEHALPLHRKYGIPGHLALVASQIGVPRNVPGSSYDGMMILSATEIASLRGEGWGVSCHGMTHGTITETNYRYELLESRELMERTLGVPVPMFCLPGDNSHWEVVRKHARESGYTSILTIYDDMQKAIETRQPYKTVLDPPPADPRVAHEVMGSVD